MTVVSGIAGLLLGLLFGWLWGRPRGSLARIADRADKLRRADLARFKEDWDRCVANLPDNEVPWDDDGWQEPDQAVIIRSGCTCDTSGTEPCPFHDR
jgi:hypothetical protein